MTAMICLGLSLAACGQAEQSEANPPKPMASITPVDAPPYTIENVTRFKEPWAMTFIPGTSNMLVTEKGGTLKLRMANGEIYDVSGVPEVDYGGQGGLGDVVVAPAAVDDSEGRPLVYLSWVEAGEDDTRGAVVGRARLTISDNGEDKSAKLEGLDVIWRQAPKVTGRGHFSHRLAFSPDGKYLFISSGERQKFDPAQDMETNLGKIVRLYPDGSIPTDNPFFDQEGVTREIWSLGHRNLLGLAFDPAGQLWDVEMGPKGGDELNKVVRGENYGYPMVSDGDHYDGREIPDHSTRPDEFKAPAISWSPVISPSSLIFYTGDAFPAWKGSALIGGLSSKSLVRVTLENRDGVVKGKEADRFDMKARIREVEQGPDGTIWLLEDGKNARLRHLVP